MQVVQKRVKNPFKIKQEADWSLRESTRRKFNQAVHEVSECCVISNVTINGVIKGEDIESKTE